MKPQPVNIGEKVRVLRLKSKKSRQELAKQIASFGRPMTREIIAKWEAGQTDVPAHLVPILAHSLHVQVTDLLPDLPRQLVGESKPNAIAAKKTVHVAKRFAIRELCFTRPPNVNPRFTTSRLAYLAENERSPLDAMILTETRAMLLSLIRRLDHGHRQVLVLHYYRGLTASQIATKLNLPVSNIAARICSARQKLHSLLCCNSAWRSLREELRDQFPPLERIIPQP